MRKGDLFRKGIGSILAVCIVLAGCSRGTDVSVSGGTSLQSVENSSEEVMAAQWKDASEETNNANLVQVMGDVIYTASWSYDTDAMSKTECRISLQQSGGGQQREIAEIEGDLLLFLVGSDGAVYYLYAQSQGENHSYYLRKDALDGSTQYCKEVMFGENEQRERIGIGAVDYQGNICFVGAKGDIYLFNAEGDMLCRLEHPWTKNWLNGEAGVVNYGETLYLYEMAEKRVVLWLLDFTEGAIGRKEYLLTERQPIALFSGYGEGLYLADSVSLWSYNQETNSCTIIFNWDDKNVNLQPDFIEQLGILDDGSLFVLYWDVIANRYGQAVVQKTMASAVKDKQTVILGIFNNYTEMEIRMAVNAFNRFSQDYQVELLLYDEYSDFYEDLLKKQGADLFELSRLSIQMLAGKGILEDLTPYFERSDNLQEKLVPCISRITSFDNKLVCVVPNFYFSSLITEKGVTKNGGWTMDEFLDLSRTYSDSKLTQYDEQPINLLLNHLKVAVGNYIDWESRECHFDDGSFAEMLEELKRNSEKEYYGSSYTTQAERLYYKELLTLTANINSVADYLEIKEAFSDFGEIVGYPNTEGRPWHFVLMNQIYGINSSSKCKDGAWEFLQFLLGEEYQMQVSSFPAIQEMLEKKLVEAEKLSENIHFYTNRYTKEDKKGYPLLTEEDKEFIRSMAENGDRDNSMEVRMILAIIQEETAFYFEEGKTAQEVAGIIQNRITLYLNE